MGKTKRKGKNKQKWRNVRQLNRWDDDSKKVSIK